MKKAMNQSTLVKILNGVSIGALVLSMCALLLYSNANNNVDQANTDRFELTYNANRFMNGSAYLTNEVRAYSATGDKTHYDNYFNEINVLKNRDIGVENMIAIGITDDEKAMIDEMSGLSNQLVPLETQAMENAMAGNLQAAIDYVYGPDYESTITKINALKNQFLETLDARAASEVEALMLQASILRIVMILFLVLVGILQVVNLLTVKRQVLQPIITIRDQMGQISQGNLSAEFPLEPDTSEIGMLVESIHNTKRELKKYIHDIDSTLSKMAQGNMDLTIGNDYLGEFRPIQDAMRQIVDSLNQALSRINWAADQVSVGSGQVAASGQVLSDGAMNQAATVQQLSASIQDLSDQVHRTTDDAKEAQTCSADASSQLELCNEKMANLMDAMENISNASKQIGGIIATIENIAFQTNILALNAAVEAARAGAAGKGFAVVADEVRNLATKSAEASKNTTALIENTLAQVRQGTELTAETTEAFHGVVTSAEQSTVLMGKIAESAVQQATSIDQLNQGMQDISGVVQTNASTAEESAAASQELNNQAETMKQAVRRFQLRQGE